MFAINPFTHPQVYHTYACYLNKQATHFIRNPENKLTKILTVTNPLEKIYRATSHLHQLFAELEVAQLKMSSEIDVNMIGQFVQGIPHALNIDELPIESEQAKQYDIDIVKTRRGKPDQSRTLVSNLTLKFIYRLRVIMKTYGLPPLLYEINDSFYQYNIPSYISILRPYFTIQYLSCADGILPLTDQYLQNWFYPRYVLTNVIDPRKYKLDPLQIILINRTTLSNSELRKYTFQSVTPFTEYILSEDYGTRVVFTGLVGQPIVIIVLFPIEHFRLQELKLQRKLTFADVQEIMFQFGTKPLINGYGLSLFSKLESYTKCRAPLIYDLTRSRLIELVRLIMEDKVSFFGVVIIGNKGTGKSSFSRLMAESLESILNEPVGTISSDAYGIYRLLEDQGLMNQSDITYAKISQLDPALPTIYQKAAFDLLLEHNIKDGDDYRKYYSRGHDGLMDTFRNTFLDIGKGDVTNGKTSESHFYDIVTSAIDCPRIVISDIHMTPLEAWSLRTNQTYDLVTVYDARYAIVVTGTVADIFLYDFYSKYQGYNHTLIRPIDLMCLSNPNILKGT